MPKVKSIHAYAWVHGGGSDQTFSQDYKCTVFADGDFETTIPSELREEWKTLFPRAKFRQSKTGNSVVVTKSRDEAVSMCNTHAEWRVETKEESELRIYYSFTTSARFARSPNGAIYADGDLAGEGYKYNEPTDRIRGPAKSFSVGLGACVVEAVRRTSRDGATSHEFHVARELDEQGERLTRYNCWVEPNPGAFAQSPKWMPYTPERAAWFADRLQEQCEEADRMEVLLTASDLPGRIDSGAA